MLLLLALLACTQPEDHDWPPLVPGEVVAGAAEGTLDLPVGTPLGGFTSRCLGKTSRPDRRHSPYTVGFVPSAGWQTRPTIKIIWIENGDQHLVLVKVDVIYSNDKLVEHVAQQLEAATGVPLEGKVVITANHSHSSYGPFADQAHFYLGGDLYNEEIFQRFVQQVVEVGLEAYEHREPAEIGAGWAVDWDPDDRVYRSRRSENNDVEVWDDLPPGYGKDPTLHVLRVDARDGRPLALAYTFGIHGIVLGENNAMISGDVALHTELILQEAFDTPVVVMHMQGAGGDASPAGHDSGYARLESVGERARDGVLDLWSQVQTSPGPIHLETASRHIWQHRDQIRVTRDGTVDWHYRPFEEGYVPDDVIWDDQGNLISPIDEFNAEFGAAFCGSENPLIPAGFIGSGVFPYSSCTDVGLVIDVVRAIFKLEEGAIELPLPETMKAGTTATRFGPIPTLLPDGDRVEQDLFAGFFPAEPNAMFSEQWRRRAEAELGHHMALLVGYAQDHEGYFLIPEDWLAGGYEPNINLWGPLQGEHVMEGVLAYSDRILGNTEYREPADPTGYYAPTRYPERPLPDEFTPDLTPEAGTRLLELPGEEEPLWVPPQLDIELRLDTPAEVRRVHDQVFLAWLGGDPMVDHPRVVLERLEGEAWVEVTTRAGRPITDALQDILVAYTPDPLYPLHVQQEHRYWASWQAVGHVVDRGGVPEGTYRLRAEGHHWAGGDTAWPWSKVPYEVVGDPFEVVPTELELSLQDGELRATLRGPADGWRLLHPEGASKGTNPVVGPLSVEVHTPGGTSLTEVEPGAASGGRSLVPVELPADAMQVVVSDAWGNLGVLDL